MAPARNVSKTPNTIADLANHLPTGTVLIFQTLSPLFSNNGECCPFNHVMMGVLVAMCGIFCMLTCFTDSYICNYGAHLHYVWVTRSAFKPLGDSDSDCKDSDSDLETDNKQNQKNIVPIEPRDIVHAIMSALLFLSITLLDQNTVNCFYYRLNDEDRKALSALPVGIAALASALFAVFPTKRRGIGCSVSHQITDQKTNSNGPEK